MFCRYLCTQVSLGLAQTSRPFFVMNLWNRDETHEISAQNNIPGLGYCRRFSLVSQAGAMADRDFPPAPICFFTLQEHPRASPQKLCWRSLQDLPQQVPAHAHAHAKMAVPVLRPGISLDTYTRAGREQLVLVT